MRSVEGASEGSMAKSEVRDELVVSD